MFTETESNFIITGTKQNTNAIRARKYMSSCDKYTDDMNEANCVYYISYRAQTNWMKLRKHIFNKKYNNIDTNNIEEVYCISHGYNNWIKFFNFCRPFINFQSFIIFIKMILYILLYIIILNIYNNYK